MFYYFIFGNSVDVNKLGGKIGKIVLSVLSKLEVIQNSDQPNDKLVNKTCVKCVKQLLGYKHLLRNSSYAIV